MKWLCTIALAGVLAGCAGAEYSPLQRDLAVLAEMPRKLDNFVKQKTARGAEAVVAAPQQIATAKDVAAVASPPLEDVPLEATASTAHVETAPVEAAPPPAPSIFEKLKIPTFAPKKNVAEAPPGAHDQIPEPIPVENPLARPPWEALSEAGPNADNELDLELLYGAGNVPAELQEEQPVEQDVAVAQPEAPLSLPPDDEPAPVVEKSEPTKSAAPGEVVIKSVAVPAVTGAKGKGNAELTAAMRKTLKQAGWPVTTSPRKDALTIRGRVVIGEAHGPNQSVKIVWDVLSPDGKRLGDLKQDNAVPAGSLDEAWGENAGYAAEAAAEGIFKLIQKYR